MLGFVSLHPFGIAENAFTAFGGFQPVLSIRLIDGFKLARLLLPLDFIIHPNNDKHRLVDDVLV